MSELSPKRRRAAPIRVSSLVHGAVGAGSVVLFLALWEVLVRVLHIKPIMLPLPSKIGLELANDAGWYAGQAAYTLMTTLAGFALSVLGGVAIAV
ncbi:MAG TPA: hypothetical protein VL522_09425, partial [Bordetella sp.]|nr:hypothetical protein [Bordetella sp.]